MSKRRLEWIERRKTRGSCARYFVYACESDRGLEIREQEWDEVQAHRAPELVEQRKAIFEFAQAGIYQGALHVTDTFWLIHSGNDQYNFHIQSNTECRWKDPAVVAQIRVHRYLEPSVEALCA